MAEKTEISWAHSTFNPWIGCTKVSPGCDNCYAKTLMDDRYGRVKWGAGEARVRTKTWGQPLAWNRKAAASGQPHRVFCASLADVFDNEVDPAWREELWNLIWMTPSLTWMLLTKRVGNVEKMLPKEWGIGWPHVWLGITVVNQEEVERDVPKLLAQPARVRFLSCEPLLGPLNLDGFMLPSPRVDWVIVGGESGPGARLIKLEWVRSIRDQCEFYGTPFHFKQWGPRGVEPLLDGVLHHAFPDTTLYMRNEP